MVKIEGQNFEGSMVFFSSIKQAAKIEQQKLYWLVKGGEFEFYRSISGGPRLERKNSKGQPFC